MKEHSATAKIFKAFDDENRLQILNELRGGEKCACVLLEHMKILCDSGIVKARREGKWAYYSINDSGIKSAMDFLWSFIM